MGTLSDNYTENVRLFDEALGVGRSVDMVTAHLQPLHGEVGVPDAAAEQGHVGHHRLHEAVVRAPEDLAVRGLVHLPPPGT